MRAQTGEKFVVACVSCERAVYLERAPPTARADLGLPSCNNDTFLPTTCWQCEQNSNLYYNRMTKTVSTVNRDWPGLISGRMLGSWWLYHVVKEKYGVVLSDREGSKLMVRIRDFWKHVLLSGDGSVTADLLEFKSDKIVLERRDWRMDSFFGQPTIR